MSRRRAVRLELVIRPVRVALKVRRPVLVIVLRRAPAVVLRPADHVINDTPCASAVRLISRRVRHREKCLDRVHVRVEAAVPVADRKFRVPGIAREPLIFVPEMRVVHSLRIAEQLLRAGTAREIPARCREHDKCVRVALLVRERRAVRRHARIPAAVLFVMQLAAEPLQRRVRERAALLIPQHIPEAVHMRHPRRDPCLTVPVLPRRAVVAEPVRAAARRREPPAKCKQILRHGAQKCAVFICIKLIFLIKCRTLHIYPPFLLCFMIHLPAGLIYEDSCSALQKRMIRNREHH